MAETVRQMFSNDLNKIDTYEVLSRVTFDVFHNVMYGWDPKSIVFDKQSTELLYSCTSLAQCIGERFFLPYSFLWKIPSSKNKKINKACE